jgi:hypothetical protein
VQGGSHVLAACRSPVLLNVVALPVTDPFSASRATFAKIVGLMEDDANFSLSHGELEELLDTEGRALLRQLLQDHLELRALREARVAVTDAAGITRPSVEEGHHRTLGSLFGDVQVTRKAYRRRDAGNLHPADGILNLPPEKYSHGIRKLAALEAARGSYESAAAAIERRTGDRVGKLQIEQLAARASVDFDEYYRASSRQPCAPDDLLVISCDGKGIVMRTEDLREPTRRAAEHQDHKLSTRLSKGEKSNSKRMAEVGCVYDVTPVPRTPEDIALPVREGEERAPAPQARAKWVTASVADDAASVIASLFDEAERRDPEHRRRWLALVDGNSHQIALIRAEARRRKVRVGILLDVVHVIEYLWRAAWAFHSEGDPAAEVWVGRRLLEVLRGNAGLVAAGMRRSATRRGLSPSMRRNVDVAANYLRNKADYLAYPGALSSGWPIGTGPIEGACRHLVKDRMGITGARWSLEGAEAVLKLRALLANGDFEGYWAFHCDRERTRNHESRYAAKSIPGAKLTRSSPLS